MAKRLIPTFNRVLVEKIVPPSKTTAGILLPEKSSKLNSGKVVAVGPGMRDKVGNLIPVGVNEGDTVLLPDYGGTQVKLADKDAKIGNGEFKIHNMQEERGVAIEVMNRGRLLEHKAVKDYKEKVILEMTTPVNNSTCSGLGFGLGLQKQHQTEQIFFFLV
ncbi:unnamed protein product [Camellia sinensis]